MQYCINYYLKYRNDLFNKTKKTNSFIHNIKYYNLILKQRIRGK